MKNDDIKELCTLIQLINLLDDNNGMISNYHFIFQMSKMLEKQHPLADYCRGLMYWNGLIVKQNKEVALSYFYKSLLLCNKKMEDSIIDTIKHH